MNQEKHEKVKVEPVTIEQKLDDLRKRLGRIEMHLINLRGVGKPKAKAE